MTESYAPRMPNYMEHHTGLVSGSILNKEHYEKLPKRVRVNANCPACDEYGLGEDCGRIYAMDGYQDWVFKGEGYPSSDSPRIALVSTDTVSEEFWDVLLLVAKDMADRYLKPDGTIKNYDQFKFLTTLRGQTNETTDE